MFSALPLLPLALLFWFLQKFPRKDTGLSWGRREGYGLALLYPATVPVLLGLAAWAMGDIDTSATNWKPVLINAALGATVGILMGLLTEEGFFRGWLWAAASRAGLGERAVLLFTTLVFTVWHASAVTLTEEFGLPPAEWPVYLANVFLIGLVWGLVRLRGGSLVGPSISHAVWNALVYGLFGMGDKTGALGITKTHLFGPEVGLLGIAANLMFAAWLWRRVRPAR
jgi:membrane protease YdiL (CAAX protease family)